MTKRPAVGQVKLRLGPAQFSAASSAASSAKRPRGKSFKKGNPYRWKPGQSGNPAGLSKKAILSGAYLQVLQQQMPKSLKDFIGDQIEKGVSVAEIMGWAMAKEVMNGNVPAATEMRKATEGDKATAVTIDLTRLNEEQLQRIANGEDPEAVIASAAGDGGDGTPSASASDSGR